MQTNTTAMAVLASEQIMPNLEGLLSFHSEKTPVTHLFIYRTNDQERSAKPAFRIKQMAESFFPHLHVSLHKPQNDEDGKNPHQVYKAISQWFKTVSSEDLVINATGGLKTMFAGALKLAELPASKVIYRDLDGTWLQLITTGGALISKTIEINRDTLDFRIKKLGIIKLVKIQSGFNDIHSTAPRKTDCIQALETAIQNKWDWRSISPKQEPSGIHFEHWFASLIATFNVDDLLVGLEPYDKSRAQMETDIWVLKDAQLTMFDLKLVSKKQEKSSLAAQITNASAQAEKFAGINVKTILIRPGYSYTGNDAKSIKKLAARFSCDIWFQEDMTQLLNHLANCFKQKSTEHEIMTNIFKSAQQHYGFLLADPDFSISFLKSDEGQKIMHLSQLFAKVEHLNYKWLGIKASSEQHFFHIAKTDERLIDQWVIQLNRNGCLTEKIGINQLLVKPINEKAKRYFKEHRGRSTKHSLLT